MLFGLGNLQMWSPDKAENFLRSKHQIGCISLSEDPLPWHITKTVDPMTLCLCNLLKYQCQAMPVGCWYDTHAGLCFFVPFICNACLLCNVASINTSFHPSATQDVAKRVLGNAAGTGTSCFINYVRWDSSNSFLKNHPIDTISYKLILTFKLF